MMSPMISPKGLDMFRKAQGQNALNAGLKFPLSGAPGPFNFTPSPAPNVPFMDAPQGGPQMIPRGGNLGLPASGPALPTFGAGYQNPMQIAQESPMTDAGPRPGFNSGLFNLGLGMMQNGKQGGNWMSMLPQIMAFKNGKR